MHVSYKKNSYCCAPRRLTIKVCIHHILNVNLLLCAQEALINHLQAICRPLANFRASRYRRPNALAIAAWGLALLFSIPQIFVWEIRYFQVFP